MSSETKQEIPYGMGWTLLKESTNFGSEGLWGWKIGASKFHAASNIERVGPLFPPKFFYIFLTKFWDVGYNHQIPETVLTFCIGSTMM